MRTRWTQRMSDSTVMCAHKMYYATATSSSALFIYAYQSSYLLCMLLSMQCSLCAQQTCIVYKIYSVDIWGSGGEVGFAHMPTGLLPHECFICECFLTTVCASQKHTSVAQDTKHTRNNKRPEITAASNATASAYAYPFGLENCKWGSRVINQERPACMQIDAIHVGRNGQRWPALWRTRILNCA